MKEKHFSHCILSVHFNNQTIAYLLEMPFLPSVFFAHYPYFSRSLKSAHWKEHKRTAFNWVFLFVFWGVIFVINKVYLKDYERKDKMSAWNRHHLSPSQVWKKRNNTLAAINSCLKEKENNTPQVPYFISLWTERVWHFRLLNHMLLQLIRQWPQ